MKKNHYQELKQSAIADDVIESNFHSVEGHEAFTKFVSLCELKDERFGQQVCDSQTHNRYSHLYEGYWYAESWCPVTNTTELKQIKPDYPMIQLVTKKGLEKYEYPVDINHRPDKRFLPQNNGFFLGGRQSIISMAKSLYITEKLPLDESGKWHLEAISAMSPREKYQWCLDNEVFDFFAFDVLKYETPSGGRTPFIYLDIPIRILEQVATEHQLILPEGYKTWQIDDKWQWIRNHPQIPLFISEGIKKAASLISHGKIAIACFSITTHSEKVQEGESAWFTDLKPELLWLIESEGNGQKAKGKRQKAKGFGQKANSEEELNFQYPSKRKIYIAFDRADVKLKSRIAVNKQTKNLAYKLQKKNCEVFILDWDDNACKGIDDFIFKHGEEGLNNLIKNAPSFHKFQSKIRALIHRKLSSNVKLNNRYCTEFIELIINAIKSGKKLIAIKSAQNTGKTELIKLLIDYFIEYQILNVTHRQSLSKNLSSRLKLHCYLNGILSEQINQKRGITICADSSYKINERYLFKMFALDEVEQFCWHLLDSNTSIAYERGDKIDYLFRNLRSIILNGGFGIIADADLSDKSIGMLSEHLKISQDDILVIENIFQPFKERHLYVAPSPEALRNEILLALIHNERLIIHTSGQQECSTHGTINLETWIKNIAPTIKVIRIDAQTIADPEHEAFKIVDSVEKLQQYQVIIASPTINTGISLDVDKIGQIDKVFGFYFGNYPLDDFSQAIERYRGDVDRYCYMQGKSNQKISYGETNHSELVKHFYHQIDFTCHLGNVDRNTLRFCNELIFNYSDFASRINSDYQFCRESFLFHAENKGYSIINLDDLDKAEKKSVRENQREIKNISTLNHCMDATETPKPDDEYFKELKNKQNKTKKERLALKKGILAQKYGDLELSKEQETQFIFDDMVNGLFPSLKLRFWLSLGENLTRDVDNQKIKQYQEHHQNNNKIPYFKDFINIPSSHKVALLEKLGISDYLDNSTIFNKDDIDVYKEQLKDSDMLTKQRVKNKLLPFAITNEQIQDFTDNFDCAIDAMKLAFDIDLSPTINHKDKAMVRFKMVLNKLGYDTMYLGRFGGKDDRHRYYVIYDKFDNEVVSQVFCNWFEKLEQQYVEKAA